MNLIFVYGPPAVGKHTVGLRLSELTGYKLFYNHLTVPVVKVIYDQECPSRSELLKKIRLAVIESAALSGIDLIFTVAYSGGPGDERFVQDIANIVEATPGGRMMYVQLFAPNEVLLQRVAEPSRRELQAHKMTDPVRYGEKLKTRNTMVSIRKKGVLLLNTAQLSAVQSAVAIVRHFGL
ncbi:MAG: hypothetical protein PVI21_01395 [Candidatus Woesebacteria bacterium]|jgi:hypothetical protein